MKQKKLVYKILIGIQSLILAFSNFNFLKITTQVNASSGIDENEANSDYVDNLRYGFNVTAGKAISTLSVIVAFWYLLFATSNTPDVGLI